MTQSEKIVQVRKLLGIPDSLRITQHLSNQMVAHDYEDMYYMPDNVLLELLQKQIQIKK